jgi:DNA-binding response OmpR family regulator
MSDIRVLIIDDEEELAAVLADRLEFRGMKAQTAPDGETALKMIKSDPPNIVLLDLMLPGMNGLEILKIINSLELNIPVILLTGYGSKEMTLEGMNLGAFDYIMKPCDFDGLISKIQEAIESE